MRYATIQECCKWRRVMGCPGEGAYNMPESMLTKHLEWDSQEGLAKVPIAEAEYDLLICVAETMGVSSEWLARELTRAAIWAFAEDVKFTVSNWEKDSKDLPSPVFKLQRDPR